MIRVLFICHGNICRSPMAEFIMKKSVVQAGLADQFLIESAATSSEELGNPVYPPVVRLLNSYGISCKGKTARQIRRDDYAKYDLLIGMENLNIRNMLRIFGEDPEHKIHLLLDWTDTPGDIDDPWYSRDFEGAYRQIEKGCLALLDTYRNF